MKLTKTFLVFIALYLSEQNTLLQNENGIKLKRINSGETQGSVIGPIIWMKYLRQNNSKRQLQSKVCGLDTKLTFTEHIKQALMKAEKTYRVWQSCHQILEDLGQNVKFQP